MIGVFRDIMVNRFWADWDQKFKRTYTRYVNPDHPVVQREAGSLSISDNNSNYETAIQLWDYIRENYDYSLTKRWRRPEQTIHEGVGDCEDYCFLIASLLPHFGVNQFGIMAGKASFQNKGEFHVWMRVGGYTIDPTASREQAHDLEYNPELEYWINVEDD